jgi:hypothetical protein
MRRVRWILGISISIALVASPAAAVAAPGGAVRGGVPPGGDRIYKGKTSQGQRIELRTNRRAGGWGLEELGFGANLTCDDGREIDLSEAGFWLPPLAPGEHDRISIDEVDPYEGLHIHGRIGPKHGSGTIEVILPALTKHEQAQACTSSKQTWTVKRREPPLEGACCAVPVDHASGVPVLTMSSRFGRHGTAKVSRSWDLPGRVQATNRPERTRAYHGKTSQSKRASLKSERTGGPWRLAGATFGVRVRCQDHTGYEGSTGFRFGSRGPRLDDGGGFGFDFVYPFEAFHLHGRLGSQAGSGMVQKTEPALSVDEEPILCTTKERTWDVERAAVPVPVPGGSSPTVRTTTG